jgi:diguanylate cyclase (GGDEF)-like protein
MVCSVAEICYFGLMGDTESKLSSRIVSGQVIHVLAARAMDPFLERRRASLALPDEVSLGENLAAILSKANEFVPSAAGSILLDDPRGKTQHQNSNNLTFVTAFGERSAALLGRAIPCDRGIAGHVYMTGLPYRSSDVAGDRLFFSKMDEITEYSTQSLVAIPIRIGSEVCGVLELINRQGEDLYSDHDRNLLQIFAGYISVSIQNILDGRRAQELARRDNLTGLYNDYHLHLALSKAVSNSLDQKTDLAVLFLDLDYFKRVNDTHGHLAGSQVLREVGQVLHARMGSSDAITARYGGDEFVIVVPGCDADSALALAEDIRLRIVHTTFCASPGEIQPEALNLTGLTCSIGVATLHKHVEPGLEVETCKSQLIRQADTAMYTAKESGRNRSADASENTSLPAPPSPH